MFAIPQPGQEKTTAISTTTEEAAAAGTTGAAEGDAEGGEGEVGDQVWPMHDQTLERRIRSSSNRRCAKSLVGTPNYIAPEILRRQGGWMMVFKWTCVFQNLKIRDICTLLPYLDIYEKQSEDGSHKTFE